MVWRYACGRATILCSMGRSVFGVRSARHSLRHHNTKSKTRPRKLSSGGGGPRGSRIVRRGRWKVSGIEAREWDETLAEEREGPFKDAMQKAIKKGAQKAGMR